MKKIVILKGSSIESLEESVLSECLSIMFPECDIEIRSDQPVNSIGGRINIKLDQDQFALSKREK